MSNTNFIHHISLKTKDAESFNKALDFYHNVFGFEVNRRWQNNDVLGAMVNTGNCLLEITSNAKNDQVAGAIGHFAISVKNLDETIKMVEEAGYSLTMGPISYTFPNSVPACSAKIAFFIGPCQESIELFEEI